MHHEKVLTLGFEYVSRSDVTNLKTNEHIFHKICVFFLIILFTERPYKDNFNKILHCNRPLMSTYAIIQINH